MVHWSSVSEDKEPEPLASSNGSVRVSPTVPYASPARSLSIPSRLLGTPVFSSSAASYSRE